MEALVPQLIFSNHIWLWFSAFDDDDETIKQWFTILG